MSKYKEDDYVQEIFYIPGNVNENGNVLGGLIKLRNLVEAIILGLAMTALWRLFFYAFGVVIKTVAFSVMVVPIVSAALIGINGESLIEWMLEFITFRKKRRNMVFKIPRPEESKKNLFSKKGKSSQESAATGEGAPLSPREEKKRKRQEEKERKKQERLVQKEQKKQVQLAKKEQKKRAKQHTPMRGN